MGVSTRLIAADLDGTPLRSDGAVSARTRAVLAQAHVSGLIVVFVTARPPRRVREIALEAGIGGLAIVLERLLKAEGRKTWPESVASQCPDLPSAFVRPSPAPDCP